MGINAIKKKGPVDVPTDELRTLSIHLAAALILMVPSAFVSDVIKENTSDGNWTIIIRYPIAMQQNVQVVVDLYNGKELTVNLFNYNRSLNLIRDLLSRKKNTGERRIRA